MRFYYVLLIAASGAVLLSSCGQDGKLNLKAVDNHEAAYNQFMDTLRILDEMIRTNQIALHYPFQGLPDMGGNSGLADANAERPNPMDGLPEERQRAIKAGFAPVAEVLNVLTTRKEEFKAEVQSLYRDIERLRKALEDEAVDPEIQALHEGIPARMEAFRSTYASLLAEAREVQEKNKAFLQSDSLFQTGYSWLLASTPVN